MPFLDHIDKFLVQKINVLVAGLVSPPRKGVVYLGAAPLGTGELDRNPAVLVEHEEPTGRVVVHLGEIGKVATVAALLNKALPAHPL